MKEVAEDLKQYLHEPGTVVYIQNSSWRNSSNNRGVELLSFAHDEAISFFENANGMVIDNDDAKIITEDEEKLGVAHFVRNGTRGIVLSSFHWGFTEKEVQDLIEQEKIKDPEEARPSIYCLLILDNHVVLVRETVCNPLKDV